MLRDPREGDVVTLPVSANTCGIGQVVKTMGGNCLLAVFWETFPSSGDPGTVGLDSVTFDADNPALLVETMDLRIREGAWPVIGTRPPSRNLPIPVYRVSVAPAGNHHLQDLMGNVGRLATPEEVRRLRNQKSFSPALVEDAVLALHGKGEWLKLYDEMLPDWDHHLPDIHGGP